MKTASAFVTMLALADVSGCQSAGPRGGGVSRDEGFKIAVPTFETAVKQGELQTVVVSIQRGEYFKRDVKLQIKASKGIGVAPTNIMVNASDKPDVQLTVTASKDAALGDYRVYVTGTPATGQPTSAEFKVQVVAP
jgi:uncharacterized membrane protein